MLALGCFFPARRWEMMGGHSLLTHKSPPEWHAGAQAFGVGLLPVGIEVASSGSSVLLQHGHHLPVRAA